MTDLIEVKTAGLTGEALFFALGLIEGELPRPIGQLQLRFCAQAIDSAATEWLIEKHRVWIEPGAHVPWVASLVKDPFQRQSGDTREQAAGRAIVASKLGNTVQVPKELIPLHIAVALSGVAGWEVMQEQHLT